MVITVNPQKLHWNYFLALERDLESLSRYIEFATPNFPVYSIELAHLLFAAASEVDVVAKLLCEHFAPKAPRRNIDDYRNVLMNSIPELPNTAVFIPRFGLNFKPWLNWSSDTNPDWWRSYNHVKHQRDAHFQEATLQNALNALGALLIMVFHHYSIQLSIANGGPLKPKVITGKLEPTSGLLRLQEDFYHSNVVV